MAYNTVLCQGSFVSDGKDKILQVRSDIDWMKVYNYTEAGDTNNLHGLEYYWQRGMAAGTGLYWFRDTAAQNASVMDALVDGGGFTLVDSSADVQFGPRIAITSSTNAVQPIFTVASTAALSTGMSVRLSGIAGQTDLNGYEFEITVIDGTTFKPTYVLANAPGVGGTGGYYSVRLNQPLFTPKLYYIINMTASSSPVVTFSVAPDLQVGDDIRLTIADSAYGAYNNIGNQSAKITAVSGASVTLSGIDTSNYGTFPFPLPASVPFSPANAIAYGSSVTGVNSSVVELNNGYIGMKLAAGNASPAGSNGDLIYWVSGKSFSVDNP